MYYRLSLENRIYGKRSIGIYGGFVVLYDVDVDVGDNEGNSRCMQVADEPLPVVSSPLRAWYRSEVLGAREVVCMHVFVADSLA